MAKKIGIGDLGGMLDGASKKVEQLKDDTEDIWEYFIECMHREGRLGNSGGPLDAAREKAKQLKDELEDVEETIKYVDSEGGLAKPDGMLDSACKKAEQLKEELEDVEETLEDLDGITYDNIELDITVKTDIIKEVNRLLVKVQEELDLLYEKRSFIEELENRADEANKYMIENNYSEEEISKMHEESLIFENARLARKLKDGTEEDIRHHEIAKSLNLGFKVQQYEELIKKIESGGYKVDDDTAFSLESALSASREVVENVHHGASTEKLLASREVLEKELSRLLGSVKSWISVLNKKVETDLKVESTDVVDVEDLTLDKSKGRLDSTDDTAAKARQEIQKYSEAVKKLAAIEQTPHSYLEDSLKAALSADDSTVEEKAEELRYIVEDWLGNIVDKLNSELHVDNDRTTLKAQAGDLLKHTKNVSKYNATDNTGDKGGYYRGYRERLDSVESSVGNQTEMINKGVHMDNITRLFGGEVSGKVADDYISAVKGELEEELRELQKEFTELRQIAYSYGITFADFMTDHNVVLNMARRVEIQKKLGKTDDDILSPYTAPGIENEQAMQVYKEILSGAISGWSADENKKVEDIPNIKSLADEVDTNIKGLVELYEEVMQVKDELEKYEEYIKILNASDSEYAMMAITESTEKLQSTGSMKPAEWYGIYGKPADLGYDIDAILGMDESQKDILAGKAEIIAEEIKETIVDGVKGVDINDIVHKTVEKFKGTFAFGENDEQDILSKGADIQPVREEINKLNAGIERAITLAPGKMQAQREAGADTKSGKAIEYAKLSEQLDIASMGLGKLGALANGDSDKFIGNLGDATDALADILRAIADANKELTGIYVESINNDTESEAFKQLAELERKKEELKAALRDIGTLQISDDALRERKTMHEASKYDTENTKLNKEHDTVLKNADKIIAEYNKKAEEAATLLGAFEAMKMFPELEKNKNFNFGDAIKYSEYKAGADSTRSKLERHGVDTSGLVDATPQLEQSRAEIFSKLVWKQLQSELLKASTEAERVDTISKYEEILVGVGKYTEEIKKLQSLKLRGIETYADRQYMATGKEMSADDKYKYYSSHVNDFAAGSDEQLKVFKLANDYKAKALKERQDAEKAAADAEARRLKEEVDAVKDAEAAKAKATADRLKAIETYFARMEVKYGRETSNSVKARYYSSHIGDFVEGSDAQLKVAKLAKDARIAALKEEENAMKATEAERARILKERQDAEKAAADAEARRLADSLDEVKNYVKKKMDLEGVDLSYGEQASYYDSQLSRFKKGSKEYEEVLMLRNIAERKAIAETKSNFTKLANTLTTIGSKITNFVNGIVNAIQNVVSFVKTTFSILKSVFVKIGSGVSGIIKLFGNLGNRVRSIFGGANKDIKGTALTLEQFKRSATELRSKIELLKSAFNAVFNNKYIDQATELYMSVYSMKNIMGGELTQATIDWANEMERAFGVSAKSMIADMNELTGVLYGLGMAGEDVATGSQNILMMSRYLAMFGAAGGSVEEVKNKLLSGLKGMTASIDDLGLSVREAQMEDYLDKLIKQGKIAKVSWQNLNEEQRIYIRYASIIDQFYGTTDKPKYDITNYGKALDTVTGRITVLKEQAKSLMYNISQIFIVFAAKIANFVSYAINLLDGLVTNLASKLGFSTEMSESMNEMFGDTGIDKANSGLEDMNKELEKAKENANKASNALASFDKLEGFTAGSSDGTEDLDFSFLVADSLAKMNEIAKNRTDFTETLKAEFDKTLEHWKNSINNFFKEWNGRDLDLGFDWPTIESELKTILSNIGNILGNIGTFIVDIGLNIADDIKLGRLITDLTVLISKFTTLADKVTKVAHPAFKAFYEQALKPINKFIGEHLSKTIRTVADEFKNWSDWVSTNGGLIVQFFDAVGRVVGAVWKVFEPYFNATWGRLIGWIADFGDELRKAFSEGMVSYIANVNGKMAEATTTAEKLVAAFTGNYNSDGSGSLFDQILQTVSELVNALKILWKDCIVPLGKELKDVFVNQILPDILEMIRELAGWIQEHSGDIKNFIMEMLPYLWKILKLVLEVVGKIMGYLIEHPGEVKGFINLLIALQGFKIAGSVLSSLGTFLTTLEKIATVLGIIEKKQFIDFTTGEVVTKVGAGKLGTKALTGLKAIGGGSAAVGTVAGTGYLAGVIQAGRGLYDVYQGTKEGDNERKNKGAGTVATVGSFAVTGAALGSTIFPGLGTVAGGGIGALVGALSSWLGEDFMDEIGQLLTETIPNAVIGIVKGIHNFTVEKAEAAAKYVTDKFKNFGDNVKVAHETLLTNASEVFTGMKDKVSTFFSETLPKAHGMLLGYVEKGLDAVLPDSINNISGTVNKLFTGLCNGVNELWSKVTGFYDSSIKPAMNAVKSGINKFLNSSLVTNIGNIWDKVVSLFSQCLPNGLKSIGNTIKTFVTVTIPNAIKDFFSNIGSKLWEYISNANAGITAGYKAITGKDPTKTRTISNPVTPIASIKGNALGGVPKSGSLFFANENGNHELIGNFGGYTGVANQGMIVDAIKQAVYEAMVAAGTATSRTTDVLRDMNINIGSNGFNIYDKSTLRQFAREIIAEIYEILRNENNPGFVLI